MKRLIIFMLTLLMGLSLVNGVLNDAAVYYSFDDDDLTGSNPNDLSGNGYLGFNDGSTTGVTGIVGQSFSLDGISNYVAFNGGLSDNIDFNNNDYTLNYWVKTTVSAGQIFGSVDGTGHFAFWDISGGKARQRLDDGPNQIFTSSTTSINNDSWFFVSHTWNSSSKTARIFVNSVNEDTTTNGAFSDSGLTYEPAIGARNNSGTIDSFTNMEVDEFSYYERILNQTEIDTLYNSGNGFNPYDISGSAITFNNPTNGQFLNNTNFTLNVSFSQITNSTYSLNGASNVTLGTNQNESTANLTGVEGLNNITVYTNTGGSLTNSSISFTIDITPPELNVNFPPEINEYTINFTKYISFNQSDGVTCVVFIQQEGNVSNCLNEAYTFSNSGNFTLDVIAQDQAGNVNLSLNNSLLVNPFASFQFELTNGTQIESYTFGGRSDVNGTVQYNYYNDGLIIGNNSLEFQKLGFQTATFNFTLNDSFPALNQTFIVTPAQLIINIFDRETGNPLSQLVNLQLTGASGLEVNTSNGSITLDGTLLSQGNYNLLTTSTGYFSDQRIFTFTNQDVLTIDLYLLNESSPNAGQIIIIVENEKQELTPNIVVTMLEQDASTNSFFEVTDVSTNINGQSFFSIELGTKKYIWRALDPVTGVSGQSSVSGERVFVDADSRTIVLRFATLQKSNLLDGFFYDVEENATARDLNISNIDVTWDDTNNVVNEVCVKYYKDTGLSKILLTSFCEASSSGFLETNVLVNTSFNTIAEVTVDPQGLLLDRFVYVSENSFETIFSTMEITDYFILFMFVAAIGLGIWAGVPWFSASATICMAWVWVSIFPSYASSGIATVITLICIGIIYAEVKKE